jgi:hypothetical protein
MRAESGDVVCAESKNFFFDCWDLLGLLGRYLGHTMVQMLSFGGPSLHSWMPR